MSSSKIASKKNTAYQFFLRKDRDLSCLFFHKLCRLCEISLAPSSEKSCVCSLERETHLWKPRLVYQSNSACRLPSRQTDSRAAKTRDRSTAWRWFSMLNFFLQVDNVLFPRYMHKLFGKGVLLLGMLWTMGKSSELTSVQRWLQSVPRGKSKQDRSGRWMGSPVLKWLWMIMHQLWIPEVEESEAHSDSEWESLILTS